MTTETGDSDPAESGLENSINPNMGLSDIRAEIQRLGARLGRKARGQLDQLALLAAGRDQLIEGIGNRRWFDARLFEEVSRSLRGEPLSLLVLDLDQFKPINDTFGHRRGDEILVDVGGALKGATRTTDTVARLGGDEFAIILPGVGYLRALVIGNRILESLSELTPANMLTRLSASIGIVQYHFGITPTEFARQADETMYAVKRNSRAGLGLYTRDLEGVTMESIQSDLRNDLSIKGNTSGDLSDAIASRTLLYTP